MAKKKATKKKAVGQLTAIAPWLGGKRSMADVIVEQLGEHISYFDLFCGSLAVPLAKPVSVHETVCDLHKDLYNLALVLRDRPAAEELYAQLHRTMFHEQLLKEAQQSLRAPFPAKVPDVHRAYLFFIQSWAGRNGIAGSVRQTFQIAVRWTHGGGSPTLRWRNAIESIPDWQLRLNNMTIVNRSAFEVLPKIRDAGRTAIYADPPYLLDTRGHKGGGSRYEHDFKEEDHVELAKQLARFKQARVVVSYYDSPKLAELYPAPQWTKIDCTRFKNLSVQNGREQERTTAPEVLLVNGPPYEEAQS